MMNLDEAIKHCEEVAEEQEKLYRLCPASESDMFHCDGTGDCITLKNGKNKGCQKCASEHQQLAEWLKELKAYRETWRKLGMWLADTRLAIAPDEFLNDVDEELVRVAQVDMIDIVSEWMDEQEVEAKQNCTDCIIDGTDACSRGAGRAVDDEICGDFIPSRSEIPNTCGDAISRQAVLDAMYELCNTGETLKENPWRDNPHIDAITDAIENLPSVTPQQRTGRWIPVSERLPEKRGDYLVTQKATFTDYVYINVVGYALNLHDVDEYDFADKKRSGWYEYDSEWGYRELDVIAWMPLPQSYQGEENG